MSGELVKAQFGSSGDVPMPADYDGDGRADLAVWRNGDGWHIQRSSDQTEQALYLGQAGDAPVIGDFDGDGLMDVAAYRASEGRWLVRYSATGMLSDVQFGQAGDVPVISDFDGDGKDDLMLWRALLLVAGVLSFAGWRATAVENPWPAFARLKSWSGTARPAGQAARAPAGNAFARPSASALSAAAMAPGDVQQLGSPAQINNNSMLSFTVPAGNN